MSTFTITSMPDDHVIVAAVTEGYVPREHQAELVEALMPVVEASPERVVIIFDFTHLTLALDDFLKATQDSLHGSGTKIFNHPKCKASIIVSPNKMWHLTAKGLQSAAFGSLNIFAYDTVDEALAALRQRAASSMESAD